MVYELMDLAFKGLEHTVGRLLMLGSYVNTPVFPERWRAHAEHKTNICFELPAWLQLQGFFFSSSIDCMRRTELNL